ncbi:MAG: FAD-dependent oxidoreductase, partial [Sedimentisphaerales bacterium]
MRWVHICLLLALFVHPTLGVEFVYQSSRQIPVVREVDLVVVGSTVGAVAAATEAAKEHAKVLLLGSRSYLGEDICATMHLWLDEGETAQDELARQIFSDGRIATPLRAKQTLEAALLDAGADFLLECYPTDLLVDDSGNPAGIVMANRAGRQAVVSKIIIDATDRAVVAGLAGAKRRAWQSGNRRSSRVVLGGEAAPGMLPSREIPAGIKVGGRELFYHEYSLDLNFGDGRFAALAEAEQKARDATYRNGQLRSAERLFFVPPDSIVGKVTSTAWRSADLPLIQHFVPEGCSRLYVLSGSADIPRGRVEACLRPDRWEGIGRMVGRAAAQEAQKTDTPKSVSVKVGSAPPIHQGDIREILRGLRPTDRKTKAVSSSACGIPILTDVDVVIIGGGTSGACAAIGASRRGADVLVVEYQEGLGGVGTMGLIGRPYHGRLRGFTKEVPFCDKDHNTEYKMEWYRNEIRKAGGKIWLGTLGCGAIADGNVDKGVLVATSMGRGAILADVVIDATGNADIAVAAGAESMFGGDDTDIALQGTGLPTRNPE